MTTHLKDKAEEISLMLVMASESDAAALGLILELCGDLAALAEASPNGGRLVRAIERLKADEGCGKPREVARERPERPFPS